MLSNQTKITISPDVATQELAGELVLLHLGNGIYFSLDDVGARVWQLIVEHRELGIVHERLCNEYQAPPEEMLTDLKDLIDTLAAKQLVEIS